MSTIEICFVIQNNNLGYKNYKLRAKKQTLISGGRFSLKKMDELFIKVLDKYIPEFPDEVKLKLPTAARSKPQVIAWPQCDRRLSLKKCAQEYCTPR